MQQPVQVSSEIFAWLAEFGLVRPKVAGAGPKAVAAAGPQALPIRVVSGLVSGEAYIELLNAIFTKHNVRQRLSSHPGQRMLSWAQVAKGLTKFAVELDEETVQALASAGDMVTLLELLNELHIVYRDWAAQEAKRRKRRLAERRSQPQQGQAGGYGARAGAGPQTPSAHSAAAASPAGAREPPPAAASRPGSAEEPAQPRAAHPSPQEHHPEQHAVEDESRDADALEAAAQPAPSADRARVDFASLPPSYPAARREPSVEEILEQLSLDCGVDAARSAPELLGLSMMQSLKISAVQVRELLASGGKRLARAFADERGKQRAHLTRWLEGLGHYRGVLAELLLQHPAHAPFAMSVLGHGLRTPFLEVAELVIGLLAGVCAGLEGSPLQQSVSTWLVDSSALRDIAALLGSRPAVHSPVASLLMSCCRRSLFPLLSQHLKQMSHGEQDYLSSAHLVLRALIAHQEMSAACAEQGLFGHFLVRCVQRLGDDRSTAGTEQAAALLAVDVWLASVGHRATLAMANESLGDLLSALKRASQSRQSPTSQLIAFACLARLLGTLCGRCDSERTPAAYRTFVYALVEAENSLVHSFAVRNLMGFLREHDGVPVGILVELMLKKVQVTEREPLSLIDLELFSVIAKHPRCTVGHAAKIAQVLARASVEDAGVGRAATVPLLAILRRFAGDEEVAVFFERFAQIMLTKMIQRGVPKVQVAHIQEVLVKVVSLPEAGLQTIVRLLLRDVCRAYLSSYEALHPNLQCLLELWPSEEAELEAWVAAQFKARQPDAEPRGSLAATGDAGDGLELRSVTDSAPGTAGPAAPPRRAPSAVPPLQLPQATSEAAGGGEASEAPNAEAEAEPPLGPATTARERQVLQLAKACLRCGRTTWAQRQGRLQQWRRPCEPIAVHRKRLAQGHQLSWRDALLCTLCDTPEKQLSTARCPLDEGPAREPNDSASKGSAPQTVSTASPARDT